MRVWDFPPYLLCNRHLLAQHNEIHAICSINLRGGGFYYHPEVKRWRGHLNQLAYVHERTKLEMVNRGMKHNYHLGTIDDVSISTEPINTLWQSRTDQLEVLRLKGFVIDACNCYDRIRRSYEPENT